MNGKRAEAKIQQQMLSIMFSLRVSYLVSSKGGS